MISKVFHYISSICDISTHLAHLADYKYVEPTLIIQNEGYAEFDGLSAQMVVTSQARNTGTGDADNLAQQKKQGKAPQG